MQVTWNKLFLLLAVVLFVLSALVAAGAFAGDTSWFIPAGLAAFAAAFLVP
jgi:hypothetical protein